MRLCWKPHPLYGAPINSKTLLSSHLFGAMLLMGLATSASAQEASDRWEISAAYFQPRMELDFDAKATLSNGTNSRSDSGRVRMHDGFRGAQLEAIWRPTQRQSVVAGAYSVDNKRRYGFQGDGEITQDGTTVEYDADASGRLDTEFSLYRLGYGFDVLQSEHFTVTALAGVYAAQIKAAAQTAGSATVDGDTYNLASRADLDETRYAPGLGLSSEWRPNNRWNVRTQVQGFKTSWGDFSNDGHFVHTQAQLGYAFTRRVTGFVGYDWFELKLKNDRSRAATVEGATYTLDAQITGRLHVHGPTVGIRARF